MKNNKLLAKYLGLKTRYVEWYKIKGLIYYPNPNNEIYYILWHPESNWNQLMMVVEKIEEDGLTWAMEHKRRYVRDKDVYFFRIWDDEDDNPVVNVNKFQRIKAAYNACVEYIKLKQ